jgi:hypothetical protein
MKYTGDNSRRMELEGHRTRLEGREIHITFQLENSKGRYFFGKMGVDGRIILKCITS